MTDLTKLLIKWGSLAALVLGIGFYIYVQNNQIEALSQNLNHTQEKLDQEKELNADQKTIIKEQEKTAQENAEAEKKVRDLIVKNHQQTINQLNRLDELPHEDTQQTWFYQPLPDSIISLHGNPNTTTDNQSSSEPVP